MGPATIKTPMKLLHVSKYLIVLSAVAFLAGQQPPQPPSPVRPAPPGQLKPPGEAPAPASAGPLVIVSPDTVVLTVGSEKLTRAQFEDVLAALAENGRPATTPAAKRQVADQLADLMAVAQEARKRRLDQSPTAKQMIMIQTDQVLASVLSKQVSSEVKIDEGALHAHYDQHKSEYEQAKASHILIRFKGSRVPLKPNQKDLTEEESLAKAQEIRKKLLDGGDFAATAKAESDDAGSAANGGSLGPAFPRGRMVAPFDQAVFSLPVGQLSEPVKSPFGYHIIKVEERGPKTFEEARPDVEKQVRPKLTQEAMDRLRKQTQITLDESYFGK